MSLLLDRRGLGIALRDNQTAQHAAMLAGNLAPDRLALLLAETDARGGVLGRHKNPPPILRHLEIAEGRPPFRVDRGRGAQVRVTGLKTFGTHLAPPFKIARLPRLERALQPAILGEVDVVGDQLGIIYRHRMLQIVRDSDAARIELGPLPATVQLEGALLADRVGALKNPVLPRRQACENLRL